MLTLLFIKGDFLEKIILPFRDKYKALGFRQASDEEINVWVKSFPEYNKDASYTVRDLMANPYVVRRVGPKMKDRAPFENCTYHNDQYSFFLRFGAVWEEKLENRCKVFKKNDKGETLNMDVVA